MGDPRVAAVACRLTEPEMRERRETVLARAARAVRDTQELPDGYAYRFDADDETLGFLFHLVGLERRCCPFLTFRVTVEPDGGPVWLAMTGPEGTKAFLADLFAPPGAAVE